MSDECFVLAFVSVVVLAAVLVIAWPKPKKVSGGKFHTIEEVLADYEVHTGVKISVKDLLEGEDAKEEE